MHKSAYFILARYKKFQSLMKMKNYPEHLWESTVVDVILDANALSYTMNVNTLVNDV